MLALSLAAWTFWLTSGRFTSLWTDRLAKYKMPSIKHTPEIVSFVVEDESSTGPYGVKAVGEISSIPTTPAITNAIFNAVGVRVKRRPADKDRLLLAMRGGARAK